jgi:hypothetical protein
VPQGVDPETFRVTIEFDSGPLAGKLRCETALEATPAGR